MNKNAVGTDIINDKENKAEKTDKIEKVETVETEIADYKQIFSDNPKDRQKNKKEKKYMFTFLVQSIICLIIICSIIIVKYASPNTFVSVSSALNGLYHDNITLSDLNRIIDEKILNNDALSAFFNMSGK